MAKTDVYSIAVSLPINKARRIMKAALKEGRQRELMPLTVVVLDAGGQLVAMEREDGSGVLRFDVARGKAFGALGLGLGSRAIGERNKVARRFWVRWLLPPMGAACRCREACWFWAARVGLSVRLVSAATAPIRMRPVRWLESRRRAYSQGLTQPSRAGTAHAVERVFLPRVCKLWWLAESECALPTLSSPDGYMQLFVPQRLDRLQVGGFAGGVDAEENADSRCYRKCQADGPDGDYHRHFTHDADQPASANAQKDADGTAYDGQQDGLHQELGEHVAGRGADSHADADFPGFAP